MTPAFDYGHRVRVIRTIRNDGTFPGKLRGEVLIRRGSVGYVRDVGTFLQDQRIYSVHFIDHNRLVGCRDQEVVDADDPWRDSRFEFRQAVIASRNLAIGGKIIVACGAVGQITRVITDDPEICRYQVLFGDRQLVVAEQALQEAIHD